MKKLMFNLLTIVSLLFLLVACGDPEVKDESNSANTATATADVENSNGELEEVVPLTLDDILAAAMEEAGQSTAHEGTMAISETSTLDGTETQVWFNATYKEDMSFEGDYGGHILHYITETVPYEGEAHTRELYIKPDTAQYVLDTEYGDEWSFIDIAATGAEYEERLHYFSPYEYLQIAQQYKDTLIFTEMDDAYEILIDLNAENDANLIGDLNWNAAEAGSLLMPSEYAFEPVYASLYLYIDKENLVLDTVTYNVSLEDGVNSLHVSAFHEFTSYMLTGVIEPPAEAYEQTGVTQWD